MDVHRKLDELVTLVEGARAMPMSASCVVNRAEILALLDDLRKNLPAHLADARKVVAERDAVVEDGRREAQRLIEEARAERSRMLAASPDAREAVAEAERIRLRSLEEIEAMRAEVDDYIDAKLANFEVVLTRTMSAVQRGRDRLRGGQHTDELRREQGDDESTEPGADAGTAYGTNGSEVSPGYGGTTVGSAGYGAQAATGGVPTYSGYVTGEYPSVESPSGEYRSVGQANDYPSGEYTGAGFPSGEYARVDYPSGEYASVDYPSGEYSTAGSGSGEYPAAAYPRASDYPGSVTYPQPADYSVSGYPATAEPASSDVANPADFGSVDDQDRYPAYPQYSGHQGYGNR